MEHNRLRQGPSGDAILLMLVKFVTMALGFTVTRLLSQYLSVYDYGTYSQALLLVSTVSSLTVLGMLDGVNYYYCSQQDPKEREAYMATIFACQCIVSTVAGFLMLALSGILTAYFENPALKSLLIFCAVLPLLQNLLGMLQILLVSVGKARMLAVRNLIVSLARLAAVVLVVSAVRSAGVVLLTTVLLDIFQILFFAVTLRRSGCRIRFRRVNFHLVKTIFSYCAPMAVFTAVNALNRDLDKYLIAVMTDTETVALYTNASKQLPFDILAASFCTVLLPEITRLVSQKDFREARALYRVFLEITYISTTMLCGAALAVAPQLIQLLYSHKYVGGLSVFCIYILVDMIRFASITLILSAAGKTKQLMLLGLAALGMNGLLNVAFYHLMGINGPALATFSTSLVTGIVLLCMSARELEGKLRDFFHGKYLLSVAAESVLGVLVFSALGRWLAAKGVWYVFVVLIVCGSYCIAFLLLNGRRLMRDLKLLNRASGKE